MRDLAHGLAQTRRGHQHHCPGRNHRARQNRTTPACEYDVCGRTFQADAWESLAWRAPCLSPQVSAINTCASCHQYTGAWNILQALALVQILTTRVAACITVSAQ